ncbi:efflux RND transporter periplasmic adaptor subunit [Helicobacter sp. 11S02629-2]|uniref:efflux RND transporter periplasmic adaptor subunit n=1 Tax=Helicobacter sp. 11S02629-2 TaxID=1476195 RepID=UPI000BD1D46A|nr:efflux RND transporter periplasmic adaptor subunit [Helicobacter sp. 11S02629-2]PAF44642.1 hypothetical protein BKH40_05285 [Helicobacter sp. 11S02629-2]
MKALVSFLTFLITLSVASLSAQTYKPITLSSKDMDYMGLSTTAIQKNYTGKGIPFSAVIDFDGKEGYTRTTSSEVIVVNIYKKEGQRVKKGEKIAEISSNELNNLFFEYQNTLSKFNVAKDIAIKDETLFKEGVISHREAQASHLAMNELQLKLNEITYTLNLFGIDVKNPRGQYGFIVRANGSGTISVAPNYIGQKIPAFSPFIRISTSKKLLATIRVPLSMKDNISVGDVVMSSNGDVIGYVGSVSVVVDQNSNSINAIANITNSKGSDYKVGEIIEVYISGIIPSNAYVVPTDAVIKNGDDYLVFKKTKTGFLPINVNVLEERDNAFVVVSSQIKKGTVIASGSLVTLKGILNGVGEGE